MKKIILSAAAIAFCMVSCNTGSTSGGGDDQNAKNLENNKKVYKALETGDAAVIDSLITRDAVDHEGPNGHDVSGPDSVRNMLKDMHNHVKDLKFDIVADASNGDYMFSLIHITGTTADNTWGMPPGTKIDEKSVDVIKLKDGKMTEHWGFADPNEMMKRMQSMPPGGKMDEGKMNKMEEKKDTSKKM